MAVLGTRIELDALPQEVLGALSALHIALKYHTTYDGVQVTFDSLRIEMNIPTVDVQVSDDER